MPKDSQPPIDRFLIAATVDRLIYGNDSTFPVDDARVLLDAMPRRPSPWFEFGLSGKMSGGSQRGFAAGVGSVNVKDDKDRQFEYSTSSDAYTRAGQWKLLWYRKKTRQFRGPVSDGYPGQPLLQPALDARCHRDSGVAPLEDTGSVSAALIPVGLTLLGLMRFGTPGRCRSAPVRPTHTLPDPSFNQSQRGAQRGAQLGTWRVMRPPRRPGSRPYLLASPSRAINSCCSAMIFMAKAR